MNKTTLERWKRRAEFKAKVEEHRAYWREQIKAEGLANRQNRIAALNDRWARMKRIIEAREQCTPVEVGGDSGLLVHQVKMIGKGDDAEIIDEYAVDTGLLKEMREHEKQAAQELGQWTEKSEIKGDVIVRQYIGINPKDV